MTDPQTRRRLQAAAGLWLLLAGMLTAMSLFPVVLALSLLMLVAGLFVIGRERVPAIELESVRRPAGTALRDVRTRAAAALRQVKVRIAGARAVLSRNAGDDPDRRAADLNQLGRRLRREGKPEEAAAKHRAALAIVKEVGDRQGEALTRNQLGLALARCGSGDAAVAQLQHALQILRALGDEEHEARVIANLGFVQRGRGHREEAAVLLHEALDKLPPESTAYRRVEAVLTRAG